MKTLVKSLFLLILAWALQVSLIAQEHRRSNRAAEGADTKSAQKADKCIQNGIRIENHEFNGKRLGEK